MFKKTVAGATLGATTLLWASPASAQDLDSAPQAVVDNLWLVIAGALVFLMQAGFAFVEAGLTRAKNLANIMAKNLADMAIGVTMFFVVGYTIAYGSGGSDWLGGFGDLFFQESADPEVLFDLGAGLTPATNFFFQVVFAATAVTIASGAMAERTKFTTYLVFAAVMTAIIYPVVVHWTWGG
ncbi:MAG TPA: ammonium transporter, partial [Acidimicrobiaceae bacterium]|nr:ammonium transporter [Acidimicrobiaceae bacterium]